MAKARSAGDLYHRVAFDLRQEVDRGDGVTVGAFVEQFQCRACYIDKHGGEAVMASRLQGKHTQVIFVRACSQTRLVTAEWQIRDARTGATYNIRDITHTQDRMWVDFLCEKGVATG